MTRKSASEMRTFRWNIIRKSGSWFTYGSPPRLEAVAA